MNKLNNPKLFAVIIIAALAAMIFCAGWARKSQIAKDSIYIDEKEAAEMVEQFKDGKAPQPEAPELPAAPPQPGQQ